VILRAYDYDKVGEYHENGQNIARQGYWPE